MKKNVTFVLLLFFWCKGMAGLSVTVDSINLKCFNDTGSLYAVVSPGNGPFTYLWSDGQTTARAYGLFAGTYTVTVTSDTSSASATGVVDAPQHPISFVVSDVQPVYCYSPTGSITVSASGGTPTYSYLWSNHETNPTIDHLYPNEYTVTITDQNGCTTMASDSIYYPLLPVVHMSTTDITCFGSMNGFINSNVASGTPPFKYVWAQSSDTNSTISNLGVGTYTVTVTDANKCSSTGSSTISEPNLLVYTGESTVGIRCFDSAANIHPAANGGTPRYTFTGDSVGLAQADTFYTITVTDANGCTANGKVMVTGPMGSVSADPIYQNDTLSLQAFDGTAPYTYRWGDDTTNVAASRRLLVSGIYYFTITDDSGCMFADSTPFVANSIESPGKSGIKVFPNPANDFVNIYIDAINSSYIHFVITDASGRNGYFNCQIAEPGKKVIDVSEWPAGIYNLEMKANGHAFDEQLLIIH